jgi:hypothetical protein
LCGVGAKQQSLTQGIPQQLGTGQIAGLIQLFRIMSIPTMFIFYKRQISIKLFYWYQRLQCRDKYFFKIKLMPISLSKSRDLADENNKMLTEWK